MNDCELGIYCSVECSPTNLFLESISLFKTLEFILGGGMGRIKLIAQKQFVDKPITQKQIVDKPFAQKHSVDKLITRRQFVHEQGRSHPLDQCYVLH